MENFEHINNDIDSDQASVRMTPEEVRENIRRVEEDDERRPAYHPNAGVGPRDDVVMSESAMRLDTEDVQKADEEVEKLLVTDSEEGDISDLLVMGDEDGSEGEEGLEKAA